ncbi:PREDICTED: E3 ubiquitin ligase BIG BROTHER [Nelumbo nucifera]|uniref:E3 ubiquitin ligase BIG BROTHER n=1 Tax=Nelumbo nucifera TaxID=4432 RepID=A0A1U8BMI7_NELNU|nr:PREDICTED: E3 ubiquitin ligase BIG BROTHER [Nelumbo nucifera]XP_010278557.1 PREDICTED: E3 ubiquitin ligase BIG BROTHER [Nelumbo nucifera]
MGSRQVDVHYVNAAISGIIEENFEGYYYLENSGLSLEEVLDQETVYQSLLTNTRNDNANASASTDSELSHDQRVGETSHADNVESQLQMDEALARNLQALEEQRVPGAFVAETTATETVNGEGTPEAASTALVVRQHDIDPDNLTFEELEFLEEAIGNESKGLSEELISYLPSFKYKTGFFSRKDKHEECVICCMEYKNRDKLTTLPCQHNYHSKCITQWLKMNKACPVCKDEVFG